MTVQRDDESDREAPTTHSGSGASGINTTIDSNTRLRHYVDESRRISQQILDDLDSGRIGHEQARRTAAQLRNQALTDTRERLTPGSRAVSEAIKEEGKSLPELVQLYSERIVRANPARFGLTPADLRDAARVRAAARTVENSEEVSRAIIAAAGRTNRAMTVVARVGRVTGPVGVAVSLGLSGYEIAAAEPGVDTARVITREAGGFAGGWLGASAGGLAAGWAASLACGPGAAVCAIVISLVVVGAASYGGGRAGEWAAEGYFDNLVMGIPRAATTAITGIVEGARVTAEIGRGIGAVIGSGLSAIIATVYGSLDPANWQLAPTLPTRTRADLSVLGASLWARVRPGSPWANRVPGQTEIDAFLANASRPLSSYNVPYGLMASIAAACRQATSADVTADTLLATSPAGLMMFLRDNGVLTFRQEPTAYAYAVIGRQQTTRP